MIRFLALTALVLAFGALVAPGFREVLAWVLAFASALLLGDLIRSSLARWRHRS